MTDPVVVLERPIKKVAKPDDVAVAAMLALAESNRDLAESNRALAEAYRGTSLGTNPENVPKGHQSETSLGTETRKRSWEVDKAHSMWREVIAHVRRRLQAELFLGWNGVLRDPRLRAHCVDANGEPVACDEDVKHDPTGPNIYSKKQWNRFVAHHLLRGKPETKGPNITALQMPSTRSWEVETAIVSLEGGEHCARLAAGLLDPHLNGAGNPSDTCAHCLIAELDYRVAMKEWEPERDAAMDAAFKSSEMGAIEANRPAWDLHRRRDALREWEREHPSPTLRTPWESAPGRRE
jgi:hypothetical protein